MAEATYRWISLTYISGGLRVHYGGEAWQQAADMVSAGKAEGLNYKQEAEKANQNWHEVLKIQN